MGTTTKAHIDLILDILKAELTTWICGTASGNEGPDGGGTIHRRSSSEERPLITG